MEGKKLALVFTDGSRLENGEITAVGISRDEDGPWIKAVVNRIGIGSVLAAELRAILEGLQIAKDDQPPHVLLRSDFAKAVNELNSNHPRTTNRDPFTADLVWIAQNLAPAAFSEVA